MHNHFKLTRAPGDYWKDEVISALQKAVRRSDERLAVYWATVLDLEGGNIAEQMWNRMLVMANEDIGPADSSVIVKVKTLYDCWTNGLGDRRLCVIHAALILARAPKSRACDHLALILYDENGRPTGVKIPDYALDKHTESGREKHRGFEHFIKEGSVLVQPDPEQIIANDKHYQKKAEAILLSGRKKRIKTTQEILEESEAPYKSPL